MESANLLNYIFKDILDRFEEKEPYEDSMFFKPTLLG
jgi:hypothetical protein